MNRHVDQASLAADAIRDRLRRDGDVGLVSSGPARFNRNEIKDPSAAVGGIFRRGIGSGTGKEGSGSAADMTPFFRRDPELSSAVRERVVRAQPVPAGGGVIVTPPVRTGAPSGVPTPGTTGTLEGRVNRGADGTVPRTESPIIGRDGRSAQPGNEPASGGLRRGDAPATVVVPNPNGTPADWRRGRAVDGGLRRNDPTQTPVTTTPVVDTTPKPATDWRGRAVGHGDSSPSSTPAPSTGSRGDVPRRIIDGTGGAHISRDHSSSSGNSSSGSSSPPPRTEHSSPPPASHPDRSSPPPPSHDSGSRDSGSHHESHNEGREPKKN